MWRVAIIFFVIIAPTLMGSLILVAMVIPSLQDDLGRWIVIAAAAGFVLAAPISLAAANANRNRLA